MTRPALPHARGLSLVELLVSLALSAMMLAPLAMMMSNMAAASAYAADEEALVRDADFALQRIAGVVLSSPPGTLQPHGDPTDSGNWFSVHFKFEHGQLMQKGPDGVLADNVTDFSITAPTVDPETSSQQQLVLVSLTLARGNATANAMTALRLGGPR